MGILSIDETTDILVYIKDLYEVSVYIAYDRLNMDVDVCNIHQIITRYIRSCLVIRDERKVIESALLKCCFRYFKQKYDNGLSKTFSVRWEERGQYIDARLVDNQLLNSHIKIILKKKNYGILQRFIQFFK